MTRLKLSNLFFIFQEYESTKWTPHQTYRHLTPDLWPKHGTTQLASMIVYRRSFQMFA